MASGYLDEEGVWQYGEDDEISPWSEYMNLGQASVSDQLGAIREAIAAGKLPNTINPTPSAGWETFGMQISRVGDLLIYDGRIFPVSGSTVTLTTALTTVATAPLGFRPKRALRFQIHASGTVNGPLEAIVGNDGTFKYRALSGTSAAALIYNSYWNYDGLTVIAA